MSAAPALDVPSVRRAFERAARSFDAAAVLHARVREDLLGRLDYMRLEAHLVIDAGSGTGHAARALARRYPAARVLAIDASHAMLQQSRRQSGWRRRFQPIRALAERMPLATGSADLILSNLMLPWCDLDEALSEFRRVLRPQGLLSFTTLGPDTLCELRSAWRAVDPHPHVHVFLDMHDVGDALVRHGFSSPVLDVERFTLTYTEVRKIARDLRALGAGNASRQRPRSLGGRGRLRTLEAAYEPFRTAGRLPATCEVIFAHAWAGGEAAAIGGEAQVSLAEIERALKQRRSP